MNLFCFVLLNTCLATQKVNQSLKILLECMFVRVCVCAGRELQEWRARWQQHQGGFSLRSLWKPGTVFVLRRKWILSALDPPFLSGRCQYSISYSLSVLATSEKSPASHSRSISRINHFGLSAELQQPVDLRRCVQFQPDFNFVVRPKL